MHQHPRSTPRATTSANNTPTDPQPSNNQRDGMPPRQRSSVDLAAYTERASTTGSESSRQTQLPSAELREKENTRMNQILQHFHTKAALLICGARASLPKARMRDGGIRQDRWFNIVLDDTDALLDDLEEWRRLDLATERPPPLVVEVYIDTANLNQNQALVITDELGKRWDVSDALAGSASSSPRPTNKHGGKYCEVVLERWTIELDGLSSAANGDKTEQLPNVYKKGVVLFRSLYAFLRFLPTWRLYRRLGRHSANGGGLKLKYRLRAGDRSSSTLSDKDSLSTPLFPSENSKHDQRYSDLYDSDYSTHSPPLPEGPSHHRFDDLRTPAGRLRIHLSYRPAVDFTVASSEALLSSRFLGLDQGLPALQSGRSLPQQAQSAKQKSSFTAAPPSRTAPREPRALLGAYGSLGTYHNTTNKRESPLSALKLRSSQEEAEELEQAAMTDRERPQYGRHTSVGLEVRSPFKAGSLSSSPRGAFASTTPIGDSPPDQKRPSSSRNTTIPAAGTYTEGIDEGRVPRRPNYHPTAKRISLNTLPQQALRAPPNSLPNETAIASSGSASPMAPPSMPRFSSAFAGRTKRTSSTSQPNNAENSAGSSARGSTSDQAASGTRSDDDDIADFLKLVESREVKDLKLLPSTRNHTVDLSKYSSMRDPSAQLADEISASSLLNHGSTPPSRRLSNVPALSTSSSPRPPQHVPHVRSRLSTQSIAEEAAVPNTDDLDQDEEPLLFATEF
ncbi:autophagy protein 13 [Recurvomyces mirabilis]|uniref:Autophagy-related protein 13 n=1 Tax=Recurvomyces mirabilis TaxID=574656 RepID=A0AAE1C569_9PEZI|nr:autophagy protein 13 [Recurvomyces mirabilis]KAK5156751.1 autophagy protein 13 [Recurvomyces mirabilis]